MKHSLCPLLILLALIASACGSSSPPAGIPTSTPTPTLTPRTTSLNDPRLVIWQPAKMAARLQAATTSDKPVLLRVEFRAGHGLNSTKRQVDEEIADMFAFLLQQIRL